MRLENKEKKAISIIRELGSVEVAFSGGVDSTLVCSLAKEALGEKAIAVIGKSQVDPKEELGAARKIAKELGIRLLEVDVPIMDKEEFVSNPPDRCYHCKKELFSAIAELGMKNGLRAVIDGTTVDDLSDVRPGMRAKKEMDVRSPLLEAGITKAEVRRLSKQRKLPTWNKPQAACLASRIPYGSRLTNDTLERIAKSERYLKSLGFVQVRVRAYDDLARIEVEKKQMKNILADKDKISRQLKKLGFVYVTIDIDGYRSGSMNEVL